MSILPDNPNLDFLRQQAKDLLVALRENDPSLALSDAQRAVAERYGFRTWPDLKAEVDRRRAEPPAADPALARDLAGAFGLGDVTAPMRPISYDFLGRRWRLETGEGRWLVGPVFDWIDNDQAEQGARLCERARAVGVHAPKPIRAADGALVKRVAGENWRVHEWTDLGPPVLEPVRSSVAADVGRTLATLHEVALPTDRVIEPSPHDFLTHRPSEDDWNQLIARTAAAGKPWLDDVVRLREGDLRELEAIEFRQAEKPLVICIQNLEIGAVRMGPKGELVVVQWDFAGPNCPEWELAYVLNQWAMRATANPATASALVSGYRERCGTIPPLDPSSFWLTITGFLNWTFSRFNSDLETTDPEDQTFDKNALRSLIADPLTVTKIEQVLESLPRAL